MMVNQFTRRLGVLVVVAAVCNAESAVAIAPASVPAATVVALSGDSAAPGIRAFGYFSLPTITDDGRVAFSAGPEGSPFATGIFLGSSSGLQTVVRTGQSVPGQGSYAVIDAPIFPPFVGDTALKTGGAGQVGFIATLTSTSGQKSSKHHAFYFDGSSVVRLASPGDALPNGMFVDEADVFGVNSVGDVTYQARFPLNPNSTSTVSALLRRGVGGVQEVARERGAAPTGEIFGSPQWIGLHDNGDAYFTAEMRPTSGTGDNGDAIWRVTGDTLQEVVREGQATPAGDAVLGYNILLGGTNADGFVSFRAILLGLPVEQGIVDGAFLANGAEIIELARRGDPAPSGNGVLIGFAPPAINDSHEVAMFAILAPSLDAPSDAADDALLFRRGAEWREAVRTGVPRADGTTVTAIRSYAANAWTSTDLLAFVAEAEDPQGAFTAVYRFDGETATPVIRTGQELAGSEIVELDLAARDRCMNPAGQIAFRFRLADGRYGIGMTQGVPEPSAVGLAFASLVCLSLNKLRRSHLPR